MEQGNQKNGSQMTQFGRSWYAVHTYSGYEDAVAKYLLQRVDSLSMGDRIFNVLVPKEKKVKVKNGKRKLMEEKIYPGYVLVDMIMNEDTWYVVRNTPRVTRFVGPDSTKPIPLSEKEVTDLLAKMDKTDSKFTLDMNINDIVKINDGPFKDYEGKISEVDEEKGRVKVLVQIFGRETAVELDSLQVVKV